MLDRQWYTRFGKLIAVGEVLVGVGIIVGGLVGVAAFFGALLNMSFMLAGSASTNPVLFSLDILLMIAWQVAGYWGADHVILPVIGAPWQPGRLFGRRPAPSRLRWHSRQVSRRHIPWRLSRAVPEGAMEGR
jgi:thiosulfate dehydrogenase [quinone] large subunit